MSNKRGNTKVMEPYIAKDEQGIPFIQVGDHVLRPDKEDLDEYYLEKSKNELRETPEVVASALEQLRELIKGEEDLYLPIDDDTYLHKFLRPCKFYPESAFKVMKRYYKFLDKNPKYTDNLMPSTVEQVFVDEVIEFLPLRVKGARVMFINAGKKWNIKRIGVPLLIKAIIMALEIAMVEPRTQVGGVHVILDLDGLTLQHILQFSPMLAKLIMDFIQECTAVRLKAIHVINQPYIFNMGYAIFKPFIGEKLRKRLLFHGTNWKSLGEHIPADFLTSKYGGNLDIPHVPGQLVIDMFKHYESDYEELTHYGYNKSPKST